MAREGRLARVLAGALAGALAAASARADVALDETRLPLRLVGTVVAARAERSLAVVESGGTTRVVHPGDSISGARVEEIGKDAIVLANASRLERLSFGAATPAPGAGGVAASGETEHAQSAGARTSEAAREDERRARSARPSRTLRGRPLAGKAAVQRASFETATTNDDLLAELSRQARFQPVLDEQGRLRGVALLGILPDSTLERFGLLSGDMVTHVAGVKVDNTANAYNTLRGLDLSKGVDLTVLRRGARTTVSIPPGAF